MKVGVFYINRGKWGLNGLTFLIFARMYGRNKKQSYRGWYDKPKKVKIEAGTGIRGSRTYGSTWWGQQWLKAFTQISDANRLPRGRTYANNGSVRSIDIKGNVVDATVQGSSLYRINIKIPVFSEQEKEKTTRLVAENPALLSRLLNRELPLLSLKAG